jgi:HSP20 family protein
MVDKTYAAGFWPMITDPNVTVGHMDPDWVSPPADAASARDNYMITMELPGVSSDDIEVAIEGGVVTVTGHKTRKSRADDKVWFFSERHYGKFRRAFRLPSDARESGLTAATSDGVLRISIPRLAPSEPGGRSIKVQVD